MHLKELSEQKELVLANTQITDAGLAHRTGLAKLQRLGLLATQVIAYGHFVTAGFGQGVARQVRGIIEESPRSAGYNPRCSRN